MPARPGERADAGLVDGDELVITGQKVWTSWCGDATMGFALVRTDPDADKHDGISYVLVRSPRCCGRGTTAPSVSSLSTSSEPTR